MYEKETRAILQQMLDACPIGVIKGYAFCMSTDFEYTKKTFKGIKVYKMEIAPKQYIAYCPNPMMTV